jgi:hypothetical protein
MQEITITTEAIRDAWATIQRSGGKGWDKHPAIRNHADYEYRSATPDSWIGASGPEINDRLQNGWNPEQDGVAVEGGEEIFLPDFDLNEDEGILQYEMLEADDDLCFVQYEDFAQRKGLTIQAHFEFASLMKADTISAYCDFLLAVIDSTERKGISPDVELVIDIGGLFKGGNSRDITRVIIPVCEAGKVVDVTAWRAFLAPGGFRSLGFVALGLAGKKIGKGTVGTLGYPVGRSWSAEFDADTDTLALNVDATASSFPADKMAAAVEAATE